MIVFFLSISFISLLTEACYYSPKCVIQNPNHGNCYMKRRDIHRVKPYEYTGKLSIKYYNVTTSTQAKQRLGKIQLSIERGTKRDLRYITIGIYEDSLSWKYLVKINNTKLFDENHMEVHVSCLKMSDQRVNMTIAMRVKNPTRRKPTKNRQGRRKYKLQNNKCLLIIFKTNHQRQLMAITVTAKNHRLCQRKRRFNKKENMRCICQRKRRRRRRKNKRKIIKNSTADSTDYLQTNSLTLKGIYSTPKNEKQILPKENCIVDVHKRTTSFWWDKKDQNIHIESCGIMNNASELIVGKIIENGNIVSCLTPYKKTEIYYPRIYYYHRRMKSFVSPCAFKKK
ncbi:uncharacterized protein LOC128157824 [Crassostrea angulata]|uniref:uncharacterized protein LOC128157824 n=1 Tax=Magallana angulata TaxID=2784310 RepID=UPI0022B0A0A0|nr:uncharacterized protein LOC128157824 [Crassostrea angulata]